jgi:hypothetical protein
MARKQFSCGHTGSDAYMGGPGSTKERMDQKDICFDCAFWDQYVDRKDEPNIVRVNHVHYVIGDENASGAFRGFGGAKWIIKFKDGREVTTTNLWFQGKVPEEFWNRLPDNADSLEGVQ